MRERVDPHKKCCNIFAWRPVRRKCRGEARGIGKDNRCKKSSVPQVIEIWFSLRQQGVLQVFLSREMNCEY